MAANEKENGNRNEERRDRAERPEQQRPEQRPEAAPTEGAERTERTERGPERYHRMIISEDEPRSAQEEADRMEQDYDV
ncbi:hypothetical protein [Streptomyces sp. TS71-3]|uniref:hypothetical protein n=1 Tax=Streptomyces sp. TS71-3 TaxID=2733862 RepID=UPI001B1BEC8B|nr:hypothetical protein [Streptomyces sp. TS71-3]GHJ39678.1 hypothetical protein Sm713_52870 [Streptomyces sp. TS71-3]